MVLANQEINHSHFQLPLVVDASSSPLFLGIPTNKGWESTVSVPEQAMEGLFRGIRQLFLNRIDSLRDVDAV